MRKQAEAALPSYAWRDVFTDPRLQTVIARGLANNQNLQIATANIEAARAQFQIQRAELLPKLSDDPLFEPMLTAEPTTVTVPVELPTLVLAVPVVLIWVAPVSEMVAPLKVNAVAL